MDINYSSFNICSYFLSVFKSENMKFATVLVFFIVVVLSAADNDFKAQFAEWKDACLKEAKIDFESAKEGLKSEVKDISEDVLCFYKCIMEKRGVLNSDGKINEMDTKKTPHLDEKQKSEVMECIKNVEPVVKCEDMRKLIECAPRWLMH